MKILTSHYLSGMPANEEYKIELTNGLLLKLTPDEYQDLCKAISDKNAEDAAAIQKADARYFKRAEKVEAFVKDLRSLFYHGDEDGDFLFRTDLKAIDEDKLSDLLDQHKEILGLE